MSKSKLGELNPMFIPKSKAFIEQMYKDKFGDNNPMFGKQKSPETLNLVKGFMFTMEIQKSLLNVMTVLK
jgi:NUMOD3 motif-containing protein